MYTAKIDLPEHEPERHVSHRNCTTGLLPNGVTENRPGPEKASDSPRGRCAHRCGRAIGQARCKGQTSVPTPIPARIAC
jgi:hypothetical protein